MSMIDKLDKLLLDLEDSEKFDEFANEYHDFVDEDFEKSCTKFSNHISHDFTVDFPLEKLIEPMKEFAKLFEDYVKDIDLSEILNVAEMVADANSEYDNDYAPENITEFKLKINADTIDYTNLTNAA